MPEINIPGSPGTAMALATGAAAYAIGQTNNEEIAGGAFLLAIILAGVTIIIEILHITNNKKKEIIKELLEKDDLRNELTNGKKLKINFIKKNGIEIEIENINE